MMEAKNLAVRAHAGLTVWFTGLSSAGKTTLSDAVSAHLKNLGYRVEQLDGDVIRRHLSLGLGYERKDREENLRRIGYVAEMLSRNQVIVLVSAISPYRAIRDEMRIKCGPFIEVYVDAPLEVCEQRDLKGIYKRARKGELLHVTGIDDPYEPPNSPEVICRTDQESIEESCARVLAAILNKLGLV
ncbi:MAG: adenylyl-sulfate kinase [Terracidiphilus sp.]